MATLAHEGLDCASKVRVHYVLPCPLDVRVLNAFSDATVTVQDFSHLVAGAKCHVTIVKEHAFRAAGVLGECRLVVTYGKPRGDRPVEVIAEVEQRLCAVGLGPIAYAPRRKQAEPESAL